MEQERRFVPVTDDLEVREGEGGPTGIAGTAAVFNESTIIAGMFEERIEPGAFDDLLESDVVGLFNHDKNFVLGRNPRTMSLSADKRALRFSIPEMPEARADVLEAVKRGDVKGNSFSFMMSGNSDDEEFIDRSADGKLPLRVIKRVEALFDVGPVTFPAYESTSVSARVLAEKFDDMAGFFRRLAEVEEQRAMLKDENESLVRQIQAQAIELETAKLFRQPR